VGVSRVRARRRGSSGDDQGRSPEQPAHVMEGAPLQGAVALTSFAKGLSVLEALVESETPLSLSGLVRATGLPKTTVHRLLADLVRRGWVKGTERGYSLGFLLLRAAAALENSLDIRAEAQPLLVRLRDELHETVQLATLDNEFRVVYLEKLVPRTQAVGVMRSRVGSTAPAHATGIGKAMLAHLPPAELERFFAESRLQRFTARTITEAPALRDELAMIRERGYAIDDEEHETGVACIAAAICHKPSEPLYGISVAGPASRMLAHLAEPEAGARSLRSVADELSAAFGASVHRAGAER
jgi:DNA-binding IclR family transcriptional regulator